MKLTAHLAIAAILLSPVPAAAEPLCSALGRAVDMARTGFGPAEGDPLPANNGQYWRSTIQISSGENCAIEGHRILSCTWEPSTSADLQRLVRSVGACFPKAERHDTDIGDGGPPETSFKLSAASIDIGLTADVLSLNVGP